MFIIKKWWKWSNWLFRIESNVLGIGYFRTSQCKI